MDVVATRMAHSTSSALNITGVIPYPTLSIHDQPRIKKVKTNFISNRIQMQSGVDPEGGGVRTNPTPPPSEKKKFFASNSCRESVEFSEVNGRLG